jgi:hypothetical protein
MQKEKAKTQYALMFSATSLRRFSQADLQRVLLLLSGLIP